MDCVCDCGTSVPRRLIRANLQGGEVALELLAWDKARTTGEIDPGEHGWVEDLIDRGAGHYRGILAAVHGDPEAYSAAATASWLEESLRARQDRSDMTESRLLFRPKLRLSDRDLARLDRERPELSFSLRGAAANAPGGVAEPDPERVDADPVEQLSGLTELHAAGALTDEEFAAAKARVIKRL